MVIIPDPDCWLGYTTEQLRLILADRFDEFGLWMYGQTMAICNGKRFDHELLEEVVTCPQPHGVIVYPWDLNRFLEGGPVID